MIAFEFTEDIVALQNSVRARMGEKRFRHSIGVAEYAYKIGVDLKMENPKSLYIAGVLHDVAKEMPLEHQLQIMKLPSDIYRFREEDLKSPTLYHAFCAPYILLRDYPEFATEEILYAVCYHTVGRADMTLFEKAIFLADYIEHTRTYPDCIEVRRMYEDGIKSGECAEKVVNLCMLKVLDNTLNFLENKDYFISHRTHETRSSIFATLSLE